MITKATFVGLATRLVGVDGLDLPVYRRVVDVVGGTTAAWPR
jgi:hypothetical protein